MEIKCTFYTHSALHGTIRVYLIIYIIIYAMYVIGIQVFKYFLLHIIILCKKYAKYKILIFRYLKLFLIFFAYFIAYIWYVQNIAVPLQRENKTRTLKTLNVMKKDFSIVIDQVFEALFVVAFTCAGILTLLVMVSTCVWMNTL